ncbi:MAG: helix-turn-helix domain-containing protein [Bacteroidales bacterium]|jgi:AraC-like DNA-binding protein|nr:helix-turn-helix domain-containing protein [Bacteroidales bacterium]
MKVLYQDEHLKCFNYSTEEDALINLKSYNRGEIIEIKPPNNLIAILMSGEMSFSYGEILNNKFNPGDILLHPHHSKCVINVLQNSTVMFFVLRTDLTFCDHFSFEKLYNNKIERNDPSPYILKSNKLIKDFFVMLQKYMTVGIRCSYFLEIKIKEFFFLLRTFYTKEDLNNFFYPILNSDFDFAVQVFRQYKKVANVKELAETWNYSLSGFEKRFKKVFGETAYQWKQHQRAKDVYHEINCTNKTFAEIAFEFDFSSPAHFHNFCKKYFHNTPGNVRKRDRELR